MEEIKPYNDHQQTKKEEVRTMFNNVASKYDFLNHTLSFGIDHLWRRTLIKEVKKRSPVKILDMATGTGDVALNMAHSVPEATVYGIDLANEMLSIAKEKSIKQSVSNVHFDLGDAENIQADNNTYDVATVAFGVRNFENLQLGLRELNRVLKKEGTLFVLEFSQPEQFPIKQLYQFYFKNILPVIGKIISKDPRAYKYLFESVQSFPYGKVFAAELRQAGFQNVQIKTLTFGICSLYIAS